MQFELVTPTPGSGHDQLAVNGAVTLMNATLQVSLPGALPAVGQTFVIIANDGTDPVSGTFPGRPEGSTFTAGGVMFQISYVGGSGNDVVLTVTFSAKTWTGAVNNLWSVGGNWSGGVAPVSGDQLLFPAGGANTNTVNDLAGLTLSGMIIEASYGLSGNAITLTGNVDDGSSSGGTITWNLPTTLGASVTFDLNASTTTLGNTITLGGNTLTLGPGAITIVGTITGTGNVVIAGNGLVKHFGAILINGTVTVEETALFNVAASIEAASLTVQGGPGTVLSGGGTVPTTTLTSGFPGAFLRPGNDPSCCGDPHTLGILTTNGNFSAASGTQLQFDLVTPAPGTGHDQIAVNGTVALMSPQLVVSLPSTLPAAGQTFVIIANDGTDPVSGTFLGRPEGSAFTVSGVTFRISYVGGTGNDVMLTAVAPTTTTLSVNPNPVQSGATFLATGEVTPVAPATGIPTGTVTIFIDGTPVATGPLSATGSFSITVDASGAGTRQVVATYNGDPTFAGSSSPPVSLQILGASSIPIPTLSEWMLLLLGAMLAFAGARVVTRG